jgi:hypothetical protein
VSDLPALPPLDPAQISDWHDAHRRFAEVEGATLRPVLAASRRLLRRLLIEGLANVQPVLADVDRPMLFPPPRRYLTLQLEQRLAGAKAAFGYLDVAAAMYRLEGGPAVVTSCMPQVLNALLAGPVTERETNAGLLRMTSTNWMPDANPFQHPDPSSVPDLLTGAVDLVVHAPAPAIARAGWLAFVMMTTHPFVDGNGRTARALFIAVSGSETGVGTDWGAAEQWGLLRDRYVQALQAGQQAERYVGAHVDPAPFMRFGADTSIRGARVNVSRLVALGEAAGTLGSDIDDLDDVELLLRVMIDRFVPLDGLLDEAPHANESMTRISALIDEGHLRFDDPPAGQPKASNAGRGLAVAHRWAAMAEQLRGARFNGS